MIYLSTPVQVHLFKFVCAAVLDLGLIGFLSVAIIQRCYRHGDQS